MTIGERDAGPAHDRLTSARQPLDRVALERLVLRWALVAVIGVLLVVFSATQPAFLTVANVFSILRSISIVAIIASAVTISLVVGGFDLSVGANAGLGMMVAAISLVILRLDAPSAVLAALFVGTAVGAVNALLIVRLRIPDLLVTLATLFIVQGLQLVLTGGRSVAQGMTLEDGTRTTGLFTAPFLALGRASLGPVPFPVLAMVAVMVALYVFLGFTRYGRALYAIGGNREAARLAGIRVERYRAAAYLASGALAAFGGVLLAAQIGRGDVGAGNPYLLDAVGAALIGYAAFGQNRPNAIGTAFGAVFIGILLNGLTMFNVPYYSQDLIKGGVLAFALVLSFTLSRDARR
jgi:simple sugar transport system permease protein